MSVLELIREGLGDQPDVEAFVRKYEVWEGLVLSDQPERFDCSSGVLITEHNQPHTVSGRAARTGGLSLSDQHVQDRVPGCLIYH